MAHFVLDSYALLAFFRNENGSDTVEQILNDAVTDKHQLYMTCINAGEIYYMMVRKSNIKTAEEAIKALKSFPIHFVDADFTHCMEAAALKAKYKFSYADAFAAALTIKQKATLITGDNEFNALKNEAGFKVKYL